MVEMVVRGQTEQVLREAQREVQFVCLGVQGIAVEASCENQQLVSFLRAQESKLQSQTHDVNQMREWMVQSLAEARARDAQIEVNTERKIQEAVEVKGRFARALSEERRRLYSEEFERRLREELRQEVRRGSSSYSGPRGKSG